MHPRINSTDRFCCTIFKSKNRVGGVKINEGGCKILVTRYFTSTLRVRVNLGSSIIGILINEIPVFSHYKQIRTKKFKWYKTALPTTYVACLTSSTVRFTTQEVHPAIQVIKRATQEARKVVSYLSIFPVAVIIIMIFVTSFSISYNVILSIIHTLQNFGTGEFILIEA